MKYVRTAISTLLISLSFASPVFAQAIDLSKIQVVNDGDWRNSKANVPWSVPVMVKDDFDGNYLAVFDKNHQTHLFADTEDGVISNWSRKYLRIYVYHMGRCYGIFCQRRVITKEAGDVEIKAGNQIFRINGKNGNFPLTEEVAYALKNTPDGETKIRLTLVDRGEAIVNNIGAGTVKAWKTVYDDALPPSTAKTPDPVKAPDPVKTPDQSGNQVAPSPN
jgi:hypothetical protein